MNYVVGKGGRVVVGGRYEEGRLWWRREGERREA